MNGCENMVFFVFFHRNLQLKLFTPMLFSY